MHYQQLHAGVKRWLSAVMLAEIIVPITTEGGGQPVYGQGYVQSLIYLF